MNQSSSKDQPVVAPDQRLPWTDPAMANVPVADHTHGGPSGPTNVEDQNYNIS